MTLRCRTGLDPVSLPLDEFTKKKDAGSEPGMTVLYQINDYDIEEYVIDNCQNATGE